MGEMKAMKIKFKIVKKIFISVLLIQIFLWFIFGNNSAYSLEEGSKAPTIILRDFQNNLVVVNSFFKTKIVAISFFNSSCAPCKKEIPELQKIQDDYPQNGKILLIGSDKSKESIQKFLRGLDINLAILWDKFNDAANKFEVKAFPALFLFDEKGKIIMKLNGYNKDTPDKLRRKIREEIKRRY
jgi:thiol-disulfide isomerase/thioredoxin